MMCNICRFCGKKLTEVFVDLGLSPLANSYIDKDKIERGELFLPLKAKVCKECFLVQLDEFESPKDIFSNYAYLSSFSDSWLQHAELYVHKMIDEYRLNSSSMVVEIACNDGYLLQYFKENNIPALGIEPASNVAEIAKKKGIDVVVDFFGKELASDLKKKGIVADLIVANNVLAHVPDLNSFVSGMEVLLKDEGIVTVEFPYLINLIEENQFDTIYHEHFSYFSFLTASRVFEAHSMYVFRVEKLKTHGGSLRVYACRNNSKRVVEDSVIRLLEEEKNVGADKLEYYQSFAKKTEYIKFATLSFLIDAKLNNKRVCGYGAPAKGNTLLNYCGIGKELIEFTVDRNPLKQNTFLPGSRIPVYEIDKIREFKPDYLIILPWNIKEEIMEQEKIIREWGGKFVTFIPELEII